MRQVERMDEVRVELVTASFVASGRPDGVHDLGRLLESLNSLAVGGEIELREAVVRPLYRSEARLELGPPLVVRRADVIFATFEGPHFTRGIAEAASIDLPALIIAPPFQIQGDVSVPAGADTTQALRHTTSRFFVLHDAVVFDESGVELGEGDRVVVNGAAVQMFSNTMERMAVPASPPARASADEDAASVAEEPSPMKQMRAA